MLTGLLFGQDVLLHKSGKIYKGKYYGIVEQNIVFYVEGGTSNKMFPIGEVTSIETSNGMLSYPFGINPLLIEAKAKELQESAEKSAEEGLSVFGGFNQSKFSHNDDDGPDNEDIYNMSGYNLTVEKSFGMARFGVGLNQRGTKVKSEESTYLFDDQYEVNMTMEVEQNLNYLTLHAVYPYTVKEKITVFGGLQLGNGLGGEAKLKVSRTDALLDTTGLSMLIDMVGIADYESVDTEEIDAEDMELDYGLFLGVDYMINEKIGLRASYFKGLSDIVEDAKTKNNTISVSLLFNL